MILFYAASQCMYCFQEACLCIFCFPDMSHYPCYAMSVLVTKRKTMPFWVIFKRQYEMCQGKDEIKHKCLARVAQYLMQQVLMQSSAKAGSSHCKLDQSNLELILLRTMRGYILVSSSVTFACDVFKLFSTILKSNDTTFLPVPSLHCIEFSCHLLSDNFG